jgi:hypothetical protein
MFCITHERYKWACFAKARQRQICAIGGCHKLRERFVTQRKIATQLQERFASQRKAATQLQEGFARQRRVTTNCGNVSSVSGGLLPIAGTFRQVAEGHHKLRKYSLLTQKNAAYIVVICICLALQANGFGCLFVRRSSTRGYEDMTFQVTRVCYFNLYVAFIRVFSRNDCTFITVGRRPVGKD